MEQTHVEVKKIKVFIATPCFGAQVSCYYTLSLFNTIKMFEEHGIEYMFGFLPNQIVTRARNVLTQAFMETDCTHLFFIDADIKWEAADVLKLIKHSKPVVIGLYPNKGYNYTRMLSEGKKIETRDDLYKGLQYSTTFIEQDNNALYGDLMEVKHGATGFMLIEKRVISEVQKHVDYYIDSDTQQKIYDIFNCKVIEEDYLTEDYYFCHLWRQCCGGKIWSDLSICLNHEGWHSFEGNPYKSFTLIK